MQTNQILSASLLDLIFDGHNKDYGAYELRKNYSKRISRALLVTLTIVALICCGFIIASTAKKNNITLDTRPDVVLKKFEEKKVEPLPEPEKPKEPEQVKTEMNTTMVIKPNDEVDNTPPTQDELAIAVTGTEDIDGPDDPGISEPADLDKGKGIVVGPSTQNIDDTPLSIVEIDAKFAGNWVAFLERNLNANVPLDNGAATGRYSVVIQFVVDTNGVVSDIKPLTNHGYGTEAEAVRVLKKASKWEPAIQNGRKVKAYRRQVIVFEINEEG